MLQVSRNFVLQIYARQVKKKLHLQDLLGLASYRKALQQGDICQVYRSLCRTAEDQIVIKLMQNTYKMFIRNTYRKPLFQNTH